MDIQAILNFINDNSRWMIVLGIALIIVLIIIGIAALGSKARRQAKSLRHIDATLDRMDGRQAENASAQAVLQAADPAEQAADDACPREAAERFAEAGGTAPDTEAPADEEAIPAETAEEAAGETGEEADRAEDPQYPQSATEEPGEAPEEADAETAADEIAETAADGSGEDPADPAPEDAEEEEAPQVPRGRGNFDTARSGRIYTIEEVDAQIRD